MSHDPRDTPNPFAPPRAGQQGNTEKTGSERLDELLPEDEDYTLNFPDDDYADDTYDPDDLLDDEEEREFNADWRDPAPLEYPDAEQAVDTPEPGPAQDWIDEDDTDATLSTQAKREHRETDPEESWQADPSADPGDSLAAGWPLGLIAVGAVALVLLIVGGYGVLSERSAMEGELRELRSQLAVAASPQDLAAERTRQRELVEGRDELAAEITALRLENQRLADTVRGLEQQLEAQQAATARATEAPPAATAPATGSGPWFVNFGSYSQREMAESWAARINPASGEVTVSSIAGGSLFRVRVVGLEDQASAQQVASDLQEAYDLSRLWVGQE